MDWSGDTIDALGAGGKCEPQDYMVKVWDVDDGLPESSIQNTRFFCDAEGDFWYRTTNSLARRIGVNGGEVTPDSPELAGGVTALTGDATGNRSLFEEMGEEGGGKDGEEAAEDHHDAGDRTGFGVDLMGFGRTKTVGAHAK